MYNLEVMYTLKNKDIGTGYNAGVRESYKNDYEFNRWFIRSRNRAEYTMTYQAISERLKETNFSTALELGPGPGTWTRLLHRKNQNAELQLVDISEAMKEQFELEMRELPNVTYTVTDIMEYAPSEPYELFFSSRAVEYLDDKPGFFKKLGTFVKAGGNGMIVTKNPYHGIRKSGLDAHQGQIPMPEMKRMLEDNGFVDVAFYPAVVRIPILSRLTSEVAEYILEKNLNQQLNINATNRTIESYVVTFTKPA